ncbi:MAG: hypothetical protein WBW85_13145 [Terriglobales bacterium]
MPHSKERCRLSLHLLALFVFALIVLSGASAAKEPKVYPESGKVTGIGQNEHTKTHPQTGNNMGGGSYSVYSHTYKIETDTRIYELDCGKTPMFLGSTGHECGGDKPLQIGDVIHFRVEKGSVHIPLSNGSEQKLRILNEEAKPETKPADAKVPDAKP